VLPSVSSLFSQRHQRFKRRLDHESCERPRKARKSACREDFLSCISCAFVAFVFRTLCSQRHQWFNPAGLAKFDEMV